MTPKEKAQELIDKFSSRCAGNSQTLLNKELSKQCALIAVDEVIDRIYISCISDLEQSELIFWGKVKEEILNH